MMIMYGWYKCGKGQVQMWWGCKAQGYFVLIHLLANAFNILDRFSSDFHSLVCKAFYCQLLFRISQKPA